MKNCFSTLIEPTELADFCLKIKEDHLQIRIKRNLEAWEDQEGTIEDLPATIKQNRNKGLFPSQQTTEQAEHQPVCQPTLRTLERLAWCTYEHGNPRDGIFRHETKSPDPRMMVLALTEPTRTATRSCVLQIFDNG